MGTTDELLSVIEECRISAPPNSVGERSLALTFFDVGWLLMAPVHQLFFYEFPHSKHHFIQTVIPILKHSLSISLQHFFPFAGNLIVFPSSQDSNTTTTTRKPEIRHVEGDSVVLTFVECNHLDFDDLKGNHPRECDKFYGLIPVLANGEKVSDLMKIPLFSVQVTLFPNKGGITIGITNHHILCDASSKFNFLRAWTAIAKCGTDESSRVLPFYDRVIQYPISLDEMFLNQPGIENLAIEYKYAQPMRYADNVRATSVLTRTHVNQLKRWVSTKLPTLEYVSSFSVACAHAWSCIAKSRTRLEEKKYEDDELEMFGFAVDWRSRLIPPIPQSYFGNCVWPTFATENTKQLSSTNGFLAAAELLGKAISETVNSKKGLIKEVESGNRKFWQDLPVTWVAGTPKLNVYDLDFGWGSPEKYEVVSIDYNGAISLNASKESSQDIEIGLCLPTKQMEAFISISEHELERICNEQAKNE